MRAILKWFQYVVIDKKTLAVILTLIALLMGVVSLLFVKSTLGNLGLASALPFTFYIALGVLTIAFILLLTSPNPPTSILLIQVVILLCALWLVPLKFGNFIPGGYHAYEFYGFSDYILRTGHINPDVGRLWYHNWPGFFILVSTITQVSGITKPDVMILLTPFVLQIIILPLVYLFLKKTVGDYRYCWLGVWIFCLANWQQYNAFIPQALGFVIFFAILILFADSSVWKGRAIAGTSAYSLMFLILFSSLVTVHMLTALAVLFLLLALLLLRKYNISTWVLLTGVVVASWTIYETATFFNTNLPNYLKTMFEFRTAIIGALSGKLIAGSESHQTVAFIRVLLMIVIAGVCFVGAIIRLKTTRDKSKDLNIISMLIGLSLIAITAGALTGGIFTRIYGFVLLPLIYFGVWLFQNKLSRVILCLVLVVLLPMHFIAQEGNQVSDYIPTTYVRGLYFFHEHTNSGIVSEVRGIAEGDPLPFGGFMNRDNYYELRYFYPSYVEDFITSINNGRFGIDLPGFTTCYVVADDSLDGPVINYLTGDPDIADRVHEALRNSMNAAAVYTNGDVTVYALSNSW